MSTLKTAVISLAFAAAVLAPAIASADTTPWWCNTPLGAWWGVQNCQAPSNGTGGLLVYVSVANSNAPTLSPSDFTVSVEGQNPSPASFGGSINGSPVVLYPGSYSVSVSNLRSYTASYSSGCSGTLPGSKYALCVITLNNTASNYYGVVPYAGPSNQRLTCSSAYPTVSIGNLGRFAAVGGKGAYNWATASDSYLNSGTLLNTAFMSSGMQTVVVTSGNEVATCSVNVVSEQGYGARPGSYIPSGTAGNPIYGAPYMGTPGPYVGAPGSYAGTPDVTLVSNSYPTLPNAGFEPENAAALAFAVVLLLGASIALYPHARKAFAVVLR